LGSETVGGVFNKCRESNPDLPELRQILDFSIHNEHNKTEMHVKSEKRLQKACQALQ